MSAIEESDRAQREQCRPENGHTLCLGCAPVHCRGCDSHDMPSSKPTDSGGDRAQTT